MPPSDRIVLRAPNKALLAIILVGIVGIVLIVLACFLLGLWQIPVVLCSIAVLSLAVVLWRWRRRLPPQRLPTVAEDASLATLTQRIHSTTGIEINDLPCSIHIYPHEMPNHVNDRAQDKEIK